uniref:Uncharacterized protein n=1 Tax=Anguilla anguilla TaxID=7936 RepID=A0A0E9X5K7_ANGAN
MKVFCKGIQCADQGMLVLDHSITALHKMVLLNSTMTLHSTFHVSRRFCLG